MDRAAQWRREGELSGWEGVSERTVLGEGEMVPVIRQKECPLCSPCTAELSVQESSFSSPSLTQCHGRSQCSAGEGVLEKSPTRTGFKRGLDYFRNSQKTGGYVRSNLSKCNQISVLSWSPSWVLGCLFKHSSLCCDFPLKQPELKLGLN